MTSATLGPQIGDIAPEFTLTRDGGTEISSESFKGRYLVLYFYPKDDTPGCTTEAIAFSQYKDEFNALGADILGISRDTVAKHEKFIAKHELTIPLGADTDGALTERYGVWVEKNMYGKKYMGIERATYLISPEGKVLDVWRKVRVKEHVEKVLNTLKSHQI